VAILTRTGLDPQDLFGKFPSDSSHVISSPFPELCSAHATLRINSLGRIEITILGVVRFGVPSIEVAHLINKHPSSMTRWLNLRISRLQDDLLFRDRINRLDQRISAAARTMR